MLHALIVHDGIVLPVQLRLGRYTKVVMRRLSNKASTLLRTWGVMRKFMNLKQRAYG